MKNKVTIILFLICISTLMLGVGIYGLMNAINADKEDNILVGIEFVEDFLEEPQGMIYFQDNTIDTLILGKWQHTVDKGWHRVYTMEPAGDDYYWGREWNISEDIQEEDLQPYGNGWFKWKKVNNDMVELHMTDNHSAIIPFEYQISILNTNELRYIETADGDQQLFEKCTE